MLNPSNKNHRLLFSVFVVALTSVVVGGSLYYFMGKENKEKAKLIEKLKSTKTGEETKGEKQVEEATKAVVKVPDNFTSIVLNGATIYYPKDWGNSKKTVTEDLLTNDPSETIKGENATFGDYEKSLIVNDYSSYQKHTYQKQLATLDKIYNNRAITLSEVNENIDDMPWVNAKTLKYNPKYIESTDKTWRGVWYLATQGQDIDATVRFIAILKNNSTGKVATIHRNIKTSETAQVEKELDQFRTVGGSDSQYDNLNKRIVKYMETAYSTDKTVKQIVDEECLKIVELLK